MPTDTKRLDWCEENPELFWELIVRFNLGQYGEMALRQAIDKAIIK